MIIRQIIIFILSALLLFFSHKWYKNDFCPNCCVESAIGSKLSGPLLFDWASGKPIKGEGYAAYESEILAGKTDSNVLELTGHYFADEENNTEYENLGYARAFEYRKMLSAENPELEFKIESKLVDRRDGVEANQFESISYAWVGTGDVEKETTIINNTGDAKILFPFNSSDKLDNSQVTAYLDNIATRLKDDSSLTVYIEGHTDSWGEPGANRRLSERRAKKIRDILKRKGVLNSQIVPSGRGEADPVESKRTAEGRQQNRRVEITIN